MYDQWRVLLHMVIFQNVVQHKGKGGFKEKDIFYF